MLSIRDELSLSLILYIVTYHQLKYTMHISIIHKDREMMKRLIAMWMVIALLCACAPPLNLNKTIQTVNLYGQYTVAYSDKWFIHPEFGRIAFSNAEEGLEAYLRDTPMTGEYVAGGVFVFPKGQDIDSIEAMLNNYQETLVVSLGNRQMFTENDRMGISGTGVTTVRDIQVDIGVVVVDIGEAFGVIVYYTSVGKVNNPLNTIRRMAATINFIPSNQG